MVTAVYELSVAGPVHAWQHGRPPGTDPQNDGYVNDRHGHTAASRPALRGEGVEGREGEVRCRSGVPAAVSRDTRIPTHPGWLGMGGRDWRGR